MNNSNTFENKEQKLFFARLDDLARRADGGAVAHSAFLTPGEVLAAERYFSEKGMKDRICFFGGYRDAQRKQIFLLPEYLADTVDNTDFDAIAEMLAEDFEGAVKVIKIIGSGFRNLSHRDYLGSVLALGIERSSLGDICILGDSTAMLFCTDAVMPLILSELTAIGRDGVRVTEAKLDVNMPSTQKYQAFTDTVASERLDCVVASLCNLSRERAQNLIRAGLVEHNYECALKIDVRVNENDVISARGFGKFIIRDLSQATKKGRLRLFADKYV